MKNTATNKSIAGKCGLTETQSAAVHVQHWFRRKARPDLMSGEFCLSLGVNFRFLFINLTPVPGGQLVNSPTAAIP
jgi:hypothetical protein